MEVASLAFELANLRRLMAHGGGHDAAVWERRAVLEEALELARMRPESRAGGKCLVLVRFRDAAGTYESSPVSATDEEIAVPFEGALSTGDERLLLICTMHGPPALALRATVISLERGIARFDVTRLPRADRLALLAAIAIDVSRRETGSP